MQSKTVLDKIYDQVTSRRHDKCNIILHGIILHYMLINFHIASVTKINVSEEASLDTDDNNNNTKNDSNYQLTVQTVNSSTAYLLKPTFLQADIRNLPLKTRLFEFWTYVQTNSNHFLHVYSISPE